MNPTARLTRVLSTPEKGKFIIPLVPYETVGDGMDFRADYCFDSKGIECPLFGICTLVIKNFNITQAVLNCQDIRLLSEGTREGLRIKSGKLIPQTYPYAVSTLRENALCANIPSLDPQPTQTQKPNTDDDSSWQRYDWEKRKDIND